MATYRLIRILKAVLPIVVIILVGIPARNYWISRGNTKPPEPRFEPPAADVAIKTNNLTFSRNNGGRQVFEGSAKEQYLYKDNKQMGRDVNVVISGEKPGDFDPVIRAAQCIYDPQTGDIHFSGSVRAQLDAMTEVNTEELIYSDHDRIIGSPVRTHVEQPGEMTGDADHMEYSIPGELLRLIGNVGMKMSNGEALHAGVGEFQKKENWARVSDGVFLEASNGWLRGASGKADLQPGTYRPTHVTIDGDVTSELRTETADDVPADQKSRAELKTVTTVTTTSKSVVSVISPGNVIRQVTARGDVHAEQKSRDELKTITGEEVESAFDDRGRLETMEARQSTAPFAKMVGSGRTLISNTIHIRSNGLVTNADRSVTSSTTVTTRDNAKLEAGDSKSDDVMTITGNAFTIVQADTSPGKGGTKAASSEKSTVNFDTTSRAKLDSVTKDGKRTSSANATHVEFNGQTNELVKLTQTGRFEFEEGARTGSADRAEITDGGDKTELNGHFSFKEGTRSAKANKALITDNGNTIDMNGTVSFVDGMRHGSAEHVKFANGGDDVELENSAKVIDDEKKTEFQARKIKFNQKTNAFDAKGDVNAFSKVDSEDVHVKAGHAFSVGDSMAYDQTVDLWRGTTHIHSVSLTPEMNNGFTAEGKVDSQMEGMHVTASTMVYDDMQKTAKYSGPVHAEKNDKNGRMILDSADMTVILNSEDSAASQSKKNGQLKELRANGKVVVTQGARTGKGDHLVYDYTTDHVKLTSDSGSYVTVDDLAEENSISNATIAQWTSAKGLITYENERGGKFVSKVKPK